MTNKGKDEFGSFIIVKHHCARCGEEGPAIKYNDEDFKLPMDLELEKIPNSILKDTGKYLGILCGCYAKFVRQIAHIQDYYINKEDKQELQKIISEQSHKLLTLEAEKISLEGIVEGYQEREANVAD